MSESKSTCIEHTNEGQCARVARGAQRQFSEYLHGLRALALHTEESLKAHAWRRETKDTVCVWRTNRNDRAPTCGT